MQLSISHLVGVRCVAFCLWLSGVLGSFHGFRSSRCLASGKPSKQVPLPDMLLYAITKHGNVPAAVASLSPLLGSRVHVLVHKPLAPSDEVQKYQSPKLDNSHLASCSSAAQGVSSWTRTDPGR